MERPIDQPEAPEPGQQDAGAAPAATPGEKAQGDAPAQAPLAASGGDEPGAAAEAQGSEPGAAAEAQGSEPGAAAEAQGAEIGPLPPAEEQPSEETPAGAGPSPQDVTPSPASEARGEDLAADEAADEAAFQAHGAGKKAVALSLAAILLIAAAFGYRFFAQPDARGPGVQSGPWSWTRLPFPPIDPRYGHAAVWTGSRMIVWGGFSGVAARPGPAGAGIQSDGAEFDPTSREWTVVPAAPVSHRPDMPAVWTGKEMIAWGGDPAQPASGIAYDPGAKRWRPLPASPLPARGGQSSVWTGTEVILWGGRVTLPDRPPDQPAPSSAGAAYNPETDAWRDIPPAPIAPRDGHVAVWTGKEMIVWGGVGPSAAGESEELLDGGAFDPVTNTWKTVAAAPAPLSGDASWTGAEMVVFGDRRESAPPPPDREGQQSPARRSSPVFVLEGFAYDPGKGSWRRLAEVPLGPRVNAAAAWTGQKLVVWGGFRVGAGAESGPAADGAAYDPRSDSWQPVPEAPIKGRDTGFSMVPASDGVIVWGGKASEAGGGGSTLADGARLAPSGQAPG